MVRRPRRNRDAYAARQERAKERAAGLIGRYQCGCRSGLAYAEHRMQWHGRA